MATQQDIVPLSDATNVGGEIVLYQPNDSIRLEVRLEAESVWLNQAQMAALFATTKQNISLHISNIFKERELVRDMVVKDFLTTTEHGALISSCVLICRQWSRCTTPSHDRWLIVDDAVYHCGHSLKDMGKKMCAITRMGCDAETILKQVR